MTTATNDSIGFALRTVENELLSAMRKHAPMHSAHEGYAVILEELDELKRHVWHRAEKRDISAMRSEAIQVAAMAIRFVVEVTGV